MKSFFKTIISGFLASKAHHFLKKNKIEVIAVTGSIGKTSTKEAIYTVLKSKFDVVASQKSFNTPIGMSLAILGEEESGLSSVKVWSKILKRVIFHPKKAPAKMILEMGANGPGDIQKLVKIAPPHISVVTWVKPVHLAEGQFKNVEEIAQEKGKLVENLSKNNVAILNQDDERVRQMKTFAKKITFGLHSDADVKAEKVHATPQELKFTVHYKKQSELVRVPLIGAFQVSVCLPAITVGLSLGMSLKECCEALGQFRLPPGRMNPIEGLKNSFILDGSYNASPSTVATMLDMLSTFSAPRKIAALGTMNELGLTSENAHLEIGQKAAKVVQLLIAVGPEAEIIKKGAISSGMKENAIHTFLDSKEAGIFLKSELKKDDLILVKGSQNKVRMERFIKEIMEQPERASKLLCRQGAEWDQI